MDLEGEGLDKEGEGLGCDGEGIGCDGEGIGLEGEGLDLEEEGLREENCLALDFTTNLLFSSSNLEQKGKGWNQNDKDKFEKGN